MANSNSLIIMITDTLDLLHISRFLVASTQQIDQCQKGPDNQRNRKHAVVIKRRIELHVLHLNAYNCIDLCVACVGRK